MRIGYLLKAFPVVSETFIVNEIRAMERHEVPLTLLSLKAAPPGPVHAMVSTVTSPHLTAPSSRLRTWPSLALDHLRLALHDAAAYRRVFVREVGRSLAACLRRPDRERRLVLRKRLRRFAWAGWVARQVQRRGIAHLHAHYATEPLRVAHLVKRLVGTPYSFTAHAKDLYQAPEGRLRRRLATARFATSCHHDGVERLRRLAPPDKTDRVLLVRHGVDLDRFRPVAAPTTRAEPAPPRLLAIGRLTPKKGFEDLVSACALLAAEGVDFRCDIVGDGKLRRALRRQIRSARLNDRVLLHGFVAQESLPEWHARATLLVAPCKELADGNRDGVPNVVLEAMAGGLPVVAGAAAGLPEIVEDGVNGLLTTPGDPADLAAAIGRLLDDPALAESMGRQAIRRVAELDFEATNRRLADEFAGILSARVEGAITRAAESAWSARGLSRKARKRLGRKPRRREGVETAIADAVRPGLEANAWRPDLERLAGRRLWDEVVKAARLDWLIPLLLGPRRDPAPVLDLGSGRGGLAVALGARGVPTVALDLRFRNCLVARLRGDRYGLDTPAINSVGESLPLADSSFGAIACLEVLEHVADPRAVLREIRRVLQDDGRCAVTVINRWAHFDPHYHLWGINFLPRRLANLYISWRKRTKISYRDRQTLDEMHYYSFRGFLRLAAELGFRVEDPARPEGGWRLLTYALSRRLSLGFNSVTLLLRPAESNVVPLAAKRKSTESANPERHARSLRPAAGAGRRPN